MKLFSNASLVRIYVDRKDKWKDLNLHWTEENPYLQKTNWSWLTPFFTYTFSSFLLLSDSTDWCVLSLFQMLCCHRHWPVLKAPVFHTFPSQKVLIEFKHIYSPAPPKKHTQKGNEMRIWQFLPFLNPYFQILFLVNGKSSLLFHGTYIYMFCYSF